MKANNIPTENPSVRLIEPDIERDAPLSASWLEGKVGHRTLMMMGASTDKITTPTLEEEQE